MACMTGMTDLSMSWSLSSSGSPLGILEVNSGGMESDPELELVLTVLAKLLACTSPWPPGNEGGRGEGVGDTPASPDLPPDPLASLLAPGLSLSVSVSLGEPLPGSSLSPRPPNLSKPGVARSVAGVSDLWVPGEPGVLAPGLSWLQGNTPGPAPAISDCSRFFLQDASMSSLRPKPGPEAGLWAPENRELCRFVWQTFVTGASLSGHGGSDSDN